MAPYYPLYIRRSDGKLDIRASKAGKEMNEPLAEQLNTKPNSQGISDFYRLCQTGETKEVDWRRKLGGMLMREIREKESKDRNYILANLPENYRLYEHVKCNFSEIDGKTQNTKKNHAAGANERQDAYLYGHPQGRKKRYRSPAEFFPHLLWLATDESGDNNNCSCKFCSPEELEVEKPAPRTSGNPLRQETNTRPQTAQTTATTKSVSTVSAPVQKLSQPSAPSAQPQNLQPTPLPRYRSMEQKEDAKFDNFFFRPGEIVWFDKGGQTWGIGLVTKRDISQGPEAVRQYRVQPISHPYASHPAIVTTHQGMRPFFSWSAPPYTNSGLTYDLNSKKIHTFDSVNWKAVIKGKFAGPGEKGDADVDGSIMGVKAVETTYTLFDPIPTAQPAVPNYGDFNGIYVGCEKIWVGEPIRIRDSSAATDIMVIQSIHERPSPHNPARGVVTLIGDTYSYRVVQIEPDFVPSGDLHLPLRVREDTRLRNNITMKSPDVRRRFTSYWRLLAKNAQISSCDIKGRWYETTTMYPHLNKAGWDAAVARGEAPDVSLMLNGTGDCNKELMGNAPVSLTRSYVSPFLKAARREDAVRNMVPSMTSISRGLDESRERTAREEALPTPIMPEPVLKAELLGVQSQYPPPANPQSQSYGKEEQQGQQQHPYVSVPHTAEGSFDPYMTFDHGEAPSAFEQQFEQTYYNGDAMQE